MDDVFNQIARKSLGSAATYAADPRRGDKTLLVALPRALARQAYGITGEEFVGYDVWHAHEATFLTNKGLPVAGTLKCVIDAKSVYIIESKSFKLYLNSFDMCAMGDSVAAAIRHYTQQVQRDLSELLHTRVQVYFHDHPRDASRKQPYFQFEQFVDLYDALEQKGELENIDFRDLPTAENHLVFTPAHGQHRVFLRSHILRARCRVTKQKDSGDALFIIHTKGARLQEHSLLRALVSLREKEEFHEFCAEYLYTKLREHPSVRELCVMLLFARRGAIDINPLRATSPSLVDPIFCDAHTLTLKTPMQ